METIEQPETATLSTISNSVTSTSLRSSFYNSTTVVPPSDYFEKYVTQYAYIAIGALGMVGNLFVLVVFLSVPAMRKKLTNIYIINQSCIDFITSLILATGAFSGRNGPYSGISGKAYCKIWAGKMLLWGFLTSSTYNLVALTIERYLEVVHPIWHKLNFNHKKAYISVAFVWMIGPTFNAAYMFPSTTVVDGECCIYCAWPSLQAKNTFGVICVLVLFLIPLCFLIFAYARIILRLTRKVVKDSTTNSDAPPKEDTFQKARKNTVKTLCIVVFCFFLCWIWNQVYYLMMNLGYPDDFTSIFYHFTVLAVFTNCCVNPFVYSLKYQPFQDAAKKLLFKRCMKKQVGDDGSSASTSEGNA